jgi:RNA polymerase sigma factor (sigma-70 family)
MVKGQVGIILQHVHKVLVARGEERVSDRELLSRFAQHRDQGAFAALVRRHGPMVFSVCQRILHNSHDAEDTFQATFLTLARKAASRNWHESVGPWLYLVASRLALRGKAGAGRHARLDPHADRSAPDDPLAAASSREVVALLHEQLGQLPESCRAPLVLCGLEGLTRDEAAQQLGWSVGTLRRRLEQGRQLLRDRLQRHGIGAARLGALDGLGLLAGVPDDLFGKTISLLQTLPGPTQIVAGTVPLAVGAKALTLSRVSLGVVCVLIAGLAAGGLWLAMASAPPPQSQAKAPESESAAKGQPGTVVPADRLGDPLPKGAVARLGTTRLRGNRCRFLLDSRRLVREWGGGNLQISEVPSGRPLVLIRASDVPQRKHIIGSTLAFTRDGKYLAAVCWDGRCGIWETATGKLLRWLETGLFYSLVACDFSPDGKLVAVGHAVSHTTTDDTTVGVFEVQTGRKLFSVLGTNSTFAADGRSLVAWNAYGERPTLKARRVAVPTGKELATRDYHGRWINFTPASDGTLFLEILASGSVRVHDLAAGKVKHTLRGPSTGRGNPVYVRHAPGRRELLAVGIEPAGIWCWDKDTGKELWQVRLETPAHTSVLSADGKSLVTSESSGIVRVWDVTTGKQRSTFRPGTLGHHNAVAVSPDGKTIATTSGGIFSSSVVLWDSSTGKPASDLPGHASAITAAAFAADGATVWTIGKDGTLRTWDSATGQQRARVPAGPATSLAVAADGKALFAAGGGTGVVRVLDAWTGREVRRFQAFTGPLLGLALTADGRQLFAAGRDREPGAQYLVRVLDAQSGTKGREFGASAAGMEQLAVRPDGKMAATTHTGRRVRLWDDSGKQVQEHVGRSQRTSAWARGETPFCIGAVALSPEGRWLTYSDQDQGIVIVDARSGQEVGRAKTEVYYQTPAARDDLRHVLAFSPDGKTVAWSGAESSSEVLLIEARTHQVRRRLPGDSAPVGQLVFSPDGRRLLSAGPDGSALVWDVRGARPGKPASSPSAAAVAGWWVQLGKPAAARAYGLMQEMTAHPKAALALLREKLKPIKAVKAARLEALLANLGADDFKEREKASQELVALAAAAEPALRAALAKNPDLEVKRRVQDALKQVEAGRLRPERAVEVLEMIADPGARKLLDELAGGLHGAALTVDAAGAAARIGKRKQRERE